MKQIEGVMYHTQKRIANNILYCMMCGRFKTEQRILAKQRTRVDVSEFTNIYKWMKCNNIVFLNMDGNPQYPEPSVTNEKTTRLPESVNPEIEKIQNQTNQG